MDNGKYLKATDYYVSNDEVVEAQGTSETDVSPEVEKDEASNAPSSNITTSNTNRTTNSQRRSNEGTQESRFKELSICGTHFESFGGGQGEEAVTDTHSVFVQTEGHPSEHSMTTTGEDDDARWMTNGKTFQEFETKALVVGKESSETGQNGNGSEDYRYPSKEILSLLVNSSMGEAGAKASTSSAAYSTSSLLHKDTGRGCVQPKATDISSTNGKASQVPLNNNICDPRQEGGDHDNRSCRNRNIKHGVESDVGQLRTKMAKGKEGVEESDDKDRNNTHKFSTSKAQYGNTCCCARGCQFYGSQPPPTTGHSSSTEQPTTGQSKPRGTAGGPFAASGINSGERSSCSSSSCCLQSGGNCCSSCFSCCSACCHTHPCSNSLCGPGRSQQRTNNNAWNDTPGQTENLSTITCSTTRRRMSTSHSLSTTTKSSEANNQVEQSSSRQCSERTTSELIKSVRPEQEGDTRRPPQERTRDVRADDGDNNRRMNCPMGAKSIRQVEMDMEGNIVTLDTKSPKKVPLEGEEVGQVNRTSPDSSTKQKMNVDSKNKKLDVEDSSESEEEVEGDMDKSTPETVIDNGQRGKTDDDDDVTSEGSDKEGARNGEGVMEWARRKKRKVQSRLNDEKQRSVLVARQTAKTKNINRASATDDRTTRAAGNKNKHANGSWSVTVAGRYHPNMAAPDLQMRLSFPGTHLQSQQQHQHSSTSMMNWGEATTKLPRPSLPPPLNSHEIAVPELDLHGRQSFSDAEGVEEGDGYDDQEDSMRQVLPVIDMVPKRKSLMRAPQHDCK